MDTYFQSKPVAEPVNGTANLEDALRYCRNLAKSHYENFIVSSIMVPRKLTQHMYNLYAFCRYSDDLADETGDTAKARELLDDWRNQMDSCYGGNPSHPILVALQSTIEKFDIPQKPFLDLISAFEQDCRVTRYATFSDLLDYCRRSADPVGRLVLYIFGYRDQERQELSDRICTGLQLANFWQDIASDLDRGRIYIPQEDMARFGVSEDDLIFHRVTESFIEMMRYEVDRAQKMFESAAELRSKLSWRLGIEIDMFRHAGMAVLRSVRKIDYDVLAQRPTLSKLEKSAILIKCLW